MRSRPGSLGLPHRGNSHPTNPSLTPREPVPGVLQRIPTARDQIGVTKTGVLADLSLQHPEREAEPESRRESPVAHPVLK